jgi:beta-glucosidase
MIDSIGRILFGDVNPSGRLPVTFERPWEDDPVHDNYYPKVGRSSDQFELRGKLTLAASGGR